MSRGFGTTVGSASNDNIATVYSVPTSIISAWAWIKPTTGMPAAGSGRLFSTGNASYEVFKKTIGDTYPDSLAWYMNYTTGNTQVIITSNLLTSDVIHSVGFFWDPTTAGNYPTVYFDGSKLTTASGLTVNSTGTGTPNGGGALTIGNRPADLTRAFSSWIADVAFWNVQLTDGEFSALANGARPGLIRPASLQLWLPIDGNSSPEPDLSGKKNNGTVTGTLYRGGPPVNLISKRFPQFLGPVIGPPALRRHYAIQFPSIIRRSVSVAGF